MKPLSVLIADDEEDIRILLQFWLRENGHAADLAASGKEALRLIPKKTFDLVVTDVLMPDGDGLDLITALKTSQPAVRILAISGGGRYIEGDNCLKIARGLGAHAELTKPFGRDQFIAAVEKMFSVPPASQN